VAVGAFETLDEVASCGIPDANALVEGPGRDVLGVWGDGDRGDAVFDGECEDVLPGFDVPEADGAVAGSGGNGATVAGEVERVDVLLVACKGVADASGGNVPDLYLLALVCQRLKITYSDQLVFRASCEISSVRTEADTSDIEISNSIHRLILQDANLLSGHDIENLC